MEINKVDSFREPVYVAVLSNGFTVIHIKRKSKLVTSRFVIAGGSMDDEVEGEAHYLEHLMYGGRHRDGFHPALRNLNETHGLLNANASTDAYSTTYYGRTWRKHARDFIHVLGDMITQPDLSEQAVEQERPIIKSEIVGEQDMQSARDAYLGTIFPLRRDFIHRPAGTVESINDITPERLQRFHQRVYTAHRSALVVIGAVDIRDVVEWIAPFAERLPTGKPEDRVRKVQYEPEQFGFHRLTIKRAQSIELDFLNRGPPPGIKMMKLSMARSFFMHHEHGVLFHALRHEHGLVYGMNSVCKAWPLHYSGIGTEGIDEANVERVIEIVHSIMGEADLNTFDEKRLGWMKRHVLMLETDALEKPLKANWVIDLWLENRLFTTDRREIIDAVARLSPADLLEAHHRYWNPDRMLVIRTDPVHLGPA